MTVHTIQTYLAFPYLADWQCPPKPANLGDNSQAGQP
jgi:hypothetical protein